MQLPLATESELREIESAASIFAEQAGQILLEYFRGEPKIHYKGPNNTDPVTEADLKSEEFLREAINKRFPDHGIVGEEGKLVEGDTTARDWVWVLDPLDGTSNFIKKLPFFAVSVGILHRSVPVCGAIFIPVSPTLAPSLFHGRLGGGAYLGDTRLSLTTPLPPERVKLSNNVGAWVMRNQNQDKTGHLDTRNLGSIAVESACVSCGTLEVVGFRAPKIWDIAAGIPIAKEAGGLIFEKGPKEKEWGQFTSFGAADSTLNTLAKWKGQIILGSPQVITGPIQTQPSGVLGNLSVFLKKLGFS
ncbi:MAG: inositol monophosphatase [Dehalococcoidia bacterium]|nr:inositol monophosphatase [Dehalococcoidia bacterium]